MASSAVRPPTVILSTDVGCEIDDQWALAYLLLLDAAGELELRAVITTHAPNLGERPSERSAIVAREIIQLFAPQTEGPPVVAGSARPLAAPPDDDALRGARLLVAEARGFSAERRLLVLTIGTATDVALAIRLEPSLFDRIEVVAMGFDRWPEGRDAWNVRNDPAAYRVILDSRVPLTIGAAQPCLRHLVVDADAVEALTRAGGPLGERLRGDFQSYLRDQGDFCRAVTGRDAWPIWDLITVAHVRGWTRWEEHPRPRLREDLGFEHGRGEGVLRWITSVDEASVWHDFRTRLAQHARTRQAPGS